MKYLLLIPIITLLGFTGISFPSDMNQKEMKSITFPYNQLRKHLPIEYARNFQPSESLVFTINNTVTIERDKLILSGKLTNPTSESISIVVRGRFNPFYMHFKSSQNTIRKTHKGPPLPRQVPPGPFEFIVPAMTQVDFRSNISLRNFIYSGTPTAEVEWSFRYWNNPETGILSVVLPARPE